MGAGDLTTLRRRAPRGRRVSGRRSRRVAPTRLGALAQRDAPLGARTTYRVGGTRGAPRRGARRRGPRRPWRAALAGSTSPVLVVGRGSNLLVADAGLRRRGARARRGVRGDRRARRGRATAPSRCARARRWRCPSSRGARSDQGLVGPRVGGRGPGLGRGRGADERGWARRRHRRRRSRRRASSTCATAARRRATRGLARPRLPALVGRAPHEVVTAATFAVRRGDAAASRAAVAEIVRWRREHQPGGANCGSVFRTRPSDHAARLVEAAGRQGTAPRDRVGLRQARELHPGRPRRARGRRRGAHHRGARPRRGRLRRRCCAPRSCSSGSRGAGEPRARPHAPRPRARGRGRARGARDAVAGRVVVLVLLGPRRGYAALHSRLLAASTVIGRPARATSPRTRSSTPRASPSAPPMVSVDPGLVAQRLDADVPVGRVGRGHEALAPHRLDRDHRAQGRRRGRRAARHLGARRRHGPPPRLSRAAPGAAHASSTRPAPGQRRHAGRSPRRGARPPRRRDAAAGVRVAGRGHPGQRPTAG